MIQKPILCETLNGRGPASYQPTVYVQQRYHGSTKPGDSVTIRAPRQQEFTAVVYAVEKVEFVFECLQGKNFELLLFVQGEFFPPQRRLHICDRLMTDYESLLDFAWAKSKKGRETVIGYLYHFDNFYFIKPGKKPNFEIRFD